MLLYTWRRRRRNNSVSTKFVLSHCLAQLILVEQDSVGSQRLAYWFLNDWWHQREWWILEENSSYLPHLSELQTGGWTWAMLWCLWRVRACNQHPFFASPAAFQAFRDVWSSLYMYYRFHELEMRCLPHKGPVLGWQWSHSVQHLLPRSIRSSVIKVELPCYNNLVQLSEVSLKNFIPIIQQQRESRQGLTDFLIFWETWKTALSWSWCRWQSIFTFIIKHVSIRYTSQNSGHMKSRKNKSSRPPLLTSKLQIPEKLVYPVNQSSPCRIMKY